ncbi:hypothetical protein Poli38472_013028 [Pythium oligandrum]|uniref:3'-5' exonuclease domain-containing protein n=1 Tax=Pythium oligandrum TaxID=41045 RepID=A0A8K1CKI0_PYTOL|nr:hypothetical protein Poli38472_013028 [Pythium oligandrum]|eukprot:TMW64406.1 hypothetical protein Poli38472_013028 [Pythium oligandrum]
MEELQGWLVTSLSEASTRDGEQFDAQDASASSVLVGQWVTRLRDAFYGASGRSKEASSNKFLELETVLLEALKRLQSDYEGQFWVFTVDIVLALAVEPRQEPVKQDACQNPGETPVEPSDSSSSEPKKQKLKRVRPQPNAPLAYVLLSALHKLVDPPKNASAKRLCVTQGHENENLRSFAAYCFENPSHTDPKLLVEILELFHVNGITPTQVYALADHLRASKSHAALIKLCQTFLHAVEWDFHAMIRSLVQSKDWGSAELVAKTFDTSNDRDLAKLLVQEAINHQEFKRAHRIVYNFQLQADFPDIELLYSRDTLMKLIEKQRWSLALTFVGSDTTLQTLLLTHVVAAGELQYATYLAKERLGWTAFDPEQVLADAAKANPSSSQSSLANLPVNGYLELSVPDENIVFCATEDELRRAHSHFFPDSDVEVEDNSALRLVGLDVEWKPTSSKIATTTGVSTTTAIASILQLASRSHVFLIDLLELHENDFLFDFFLPRLLTSTEYLPVGFGFDSDLKVMHQTFPERSVFRHLPRILELSAVLQKAFGPGFGNSLSNATRQILGKPLDKRMQLSNWDERPLSTGQRVYAALDASCLLEIAQHIQSHGLRVDASTVVSWTDVLAQLSVVTLSQPLTSANAIATAASQRRAYQSEWKAQLETKSGLDANTLCTTNDVLAFWNTLTTPATESPHPQLELLPMHELPKLLIQQAGETSKYIAVNSICFFADERPCVACIDANAKLDTSRLAALCGLSRRKIKLASAMECESIWGFAPGTVPPFGHRTGANVALFVDETLREDKYWLAGSGSHDQLLVVPSTAYFAKLSDLTVADIALLPQGSRRTTQRTENKDAFSVYAGPLEGSDPLEYRFLADTMVARVGRWLRTIGTDVVVWDAETEATLPPNVDRKSALLRLAAKDQRIILTRDKKLADRRDAGACFVVTSDDPHQQFHEIRGHFAIELKREEMMTRCAKCNFKGFDIVDVEYVKQQTYDVVHPNVLEVVTEFWKCQGCHKIYWEGPKYSSAYENMLQMFEKAAALESAQ